MRTQDNQLYSILVCRFLLAYLYWDYQLYSYMLSVHEIDLKKNSMQIRKFSVFPIIARCRYTSFFMRILLENAKIFSAAKAAQEAQMSVRPFVRSFVRPSGYFHFDSL